MRVWYWKMRAARTNIERRNVSKLGAKEQQEEGSRRQPQPKVFISYRQDESKYQAKRMHDAFARVLPPGHIFMDVDTVPLGVDFVIRRLGQQMRDTTRAYRAELDFRR
jgi:hypothetical protein